MTDREKFINGWGLRIAVCSVGIFIAVILQSVTMNEVKLQEENKLWNNGECAICGADWEYLD